MRKMTEFGLIRRLRWTGQSHAAFERQYLFGSLYLYHSFSVIVAQPLSFTIAHEKDVPILAAALHANADYLLRARAKTTLHFKCRCIPPGYVPKTEKYLDITMPSHLAGQAPQHLKLRIYFCANPYR